MSTQGWASIAFPIDLADAEVKQTLREYSVDIDKLEGTAVWNIEVENFDGILQINDSNRDGGDFKDLETLLIQKKIPFDRDTGILDDDSGGTRYIYRPGQDGKPDMHRETCNLDGDDLAVVNDIRENLTKGVSTLWEYLDTRFPEFQSLEEIVTEIRGSN